MFCKRKNQAAFWFEYAKQIEIDRWFSAIFDSHTNKWTNISIFDFFQSQQGELDLLNAKAQDILRQADPINRSNIEQENTNINRDWNNLVHELENRVETLNGLGQHWEELDKRIHTFESQLARLDERNRNVDPVVRSRRHLEDTKNVIQVSFRQNFNSVFIHRRRFSLSIVNLLRKLQHYLIDQMIIIQNSAAYKME